MMFIGVKGCVLLLANLANPQPQRKNYKRVFCKHTMTTDDFTPTLCPQYRPLHQPYPLLIKVSPTKVCIDNTTCLAILMAPIFYGVAESKHKSELPIKLKVD